MEVKDRLAGLSALIRDKTVTAPVEAAFNGQLPGEGDDAAREVRIVIRKRGQAVDMSSGNDEQVNRRLRMYVLEGDISIILVYYFRR